MVAAETIGTGQLRNGRPYHNRYAWIIEIRDGLVGQLHEYMDTAYVRSVV
jgi:ketosteroid isomerase-like protein